MSRRVHGFQVQLKHSKQSYCGHQWSPSGSDRKWYICTQAYAATVIYIFVCEHGQNPSWLHCAQHQRKPWEIQDRNSDYRHVSSPIQNFVQSLKLQTLLQNNTEIQIADPSPVLYQNSNYGPFPMLYRNSDYSSFSKDNTKIQITHSLTIQCRNLSYRPVSNIMGISNNKQFSNTIQKFLLQTLL